MPLSGRTTGEIDELKSKLLGQIPDNESIGNKALREALSWDTDLYLAVRARLIDEGEVATGRGRGGSVRKVDITAPEDSEDSAEQYPNEASLYDPMIKVLRERWVKDQPFDQFVVENTALGGRRADGVWTRPDVTVAAMTTFTYVPGRHLDVVTFEIKHYRGLNVTAIYEALAHRRSSTRAFVLAFIPDEQFTQVRDTVLPELQEEAARHGVGLILAGDPEDFDTWEIREDSEAHVPDPVRLNTFIRNQLSEGTRDQIVRWFR